MALFLRESYRVKLDIKRERLVVWCFGGFCFVVVVLLFFFCEWLMMWNDLSLIKVGVGCSKGTPGGDSEWKSILANGTYPIVQNGINDNTVWPIEATGIKNFNLICIHSF